SAGGPVRPDRHPPAARVAHRPAGKPGRARPVHRPACPLPGAAGDDTHDPAGGGGPDAVGALTGGLGRRVGMSSELAERYRRWFEYEKDAHARVVSSLESVPAERRAAPEFQRAVGLLAHIAAARRLWLWRLGAAPEAPESLFPEDA